MSNIKECVLMDRECTDCGECNICDLDPSKICDNCCKCIDIDADYKSIQIDEIIEDESMIPDQKDLDNWKFDNYIVDYSTEENSEKHKNSMKKTRSSEND
jgi:hypothetical protein